MPIVNFPVVTSSLMAVSHLTDTSLNISDEPYIIGLLSETSQAQPRVILTVPKPNP